MKLLQDAARAWAEQHNWSLVTEQEWVKRAQAIEPTPKSEEAARKVCFTVYCEVLYYACQDSQLRQQAYRELYDYLWLLAYPRVGETLVNEAAQDAIVLVFRSFEDDIQSCREPRAFLNFAYWQLTAAISTLRRPNIQEGLIKEAEQLNDKTHKINERQESVDKPLLQKEREAWLEQLRCHIALKVLHCLVQLWQRKGIRRQLTAVILAFMDYADDQTIAHYLQAASVKSIEPLRSRGLDKLQQCLQPQLAASNWGLS